MGLLGLWLGLLSLILAVVMVAYRPAFNDTLVVITLYGGIFAYTLAGLVLWGTRKAKDEFRDARAQAKLAIALALPGTIIVYLLVAMAKDVTPT